MSHWAEIDESNIVIRVLVGDNDSPDEGKSVMESLGGTWIQTSYNSNFRANYAGVGFTYDPVSDVFIAPMPDCGHEELELNQETFRWECQNAEHSAIPEWIQNAEIS
jgi:hypothetical protein